MRQILHILRKDLRRLWIEVVLIIAADLLSVRTNWLQTLPEAPTDWYMRPPFVTLVLFFLWWFTIARLIQDEPLVGDRQFWITRPYEWPKLLAAKIAFVLLVICLPYGLITQITLKLGKFSILNNAAETLGALLALTIVVSLPVAALATLTRKLPHWLLAIVGLVLCFVLIASSDSYIGGKSNISAATDTPETLEFVGFLLLSLVVILVQYARRKTVTSWLLMGAAVALMPIIMAVAPYKKLLERKYPLIPTLHEPIFHASIIDIPDRQDSNVPGGTSKEVRLYLPLRVSDIRKDHIVDIDAVAMVIDTQDGFHWTSDWQSGSGYFYPHTDTVQLPFTIERQVFDRVRLAKSQVRLLLAVTELKKKDSFRVVVQPQFEVPQFGKCWIASSGSVDCRTTSASPEYEVLTLRSDDETCQREMATEDTPELPKGLTSQDMNSSSGDPFGPFELRSFNLSRWYQSGVPADLHPRLCPGTALDAKSYEKGELYRLDIGLGELRLADFQKNNFELFQ